MREVGGGRYVGRLGGRERQGEEKREPCLHPLAPTALNPKQRLEALAPPHPPTCALALSKYCQLGRVTCIGASDPLPVHSHVLRRAQGAASSEIRQLSKPYRLLPRVEMGDLQGRLPKLCKCLGKKLLTNHQASSGTYRRASVSFHGPKLLTNHQASSGNQRYLSPAQLGQSVYLGGQHGRSVTPTARPSRAITVSPRQLKQSVKARGQCVRRYL